ncbi:unnamed protein product [Rangifer tarandus platyrhynchus]|uniref:Uncharacterized protein n=1 Tax=Rangifer tarandus platyrhynchus TaxID=3082113 RepID=A0ABN8Y2L3_RANTA|nr:unnamed protein product [Rangifer tarandus platyrhynchus]
MGAAWPGTGDLPPATALEAGDSPDARRPAPRAFARRPHRSSTFPRTKETRLAPGEQVAFNTTILDWMREREAERWGRTRPFAGGFIRLALSHQLKYPFHSQKRGAGRKPVRAVKEELVPADLAMYPIPYQYPGKRGKAFWIGSLGTDY